LLVTGVAADHIDDAATADDLAVLAYSLDAATDFHGRNLLAALGMVQSA
jgi:hypothetical protein